MSQVKFNYRNLHAVFVENLTKPLVTKQGAENIRNYDYHSQDWSKLVKYLQPFWNKCVTYIPARASPNVVTITGYVFALFGCLSVIFYGETHPWVYGLYAAMLFLYQTFDALDGLQGKKVGMYTNATTEIFDHGFDSNVLILTTLASVSGFQILGSFLETIFLMSCLVSFYFMTWENTCTGVMFFRSGFLNPTDSLVITQIFFLITAFMPNLWISQVKDFMPFTAPSSGFFGFFFNLTLAESVVYSGVFTALQAGYYSMVEVMEYWKKKHNHPKATPMVIRDFSQSCIALLPIGLLTLNTVMWTMVRESYALKSHPYLVIITISLPWLYSIMRLIIAEITHQTVDVFGLLIGQIPLFFPVVAGYLPFSETFEIPAMFLSLLLSIALYTRTVHRSLADTCKALNMAHFWTIPPPQKKKSDDNKNNSGLKKSGENKKSASPSPKLKRSVS